MLKIICLSLTILIGCSAPKKLVLKAESPAEVVLTAVQKKYRIMCLNGSARSCYKIGKELFKLNSPYKSFSYFLASCNLDYGLGCYEAGKYEYQENKSLKDALYFFKKGCRYLNGDSCYELGTYFINTQKQMATDYFMRSCDHNLANGCKKTADIFYTEDNFNKAYKYYKKSCQMGDYSSCFNTGLSAHKMGNKEKMIKFYKIGCEGLYANACYNLSCYFSVENDVANSFLYFEKALNYGFRDWNKIEFDHDLRNLKFDPRYNNLIKLFKYNKNQT